MYEGNSRTALVLDRHPLWLDAVDGVLGRLGFDVVGKTTSPERALGIVSTQRPDLLVTGTDVGPGALDGVVCVAKARELNGELRAVVLADAADSATMDAAFSAGACAYVLKSAHPDDLASAIRQAFDQSVFLPGNGAQVAARTLHSERAHDLTPREREILRLVAEGYSNAQLARMLWVTEQTVKFHLSNVYRKLDVSNRTEAARWAQLHGILAEPRPQLSVA